MVKKAKKKVLKKKKLMDKIPYFWKVVGTILLAGLIIGALLTLAYGIYLGITGLFFGTAVPIAVYTYYERNRIDDIEKHFPDFLRDLAEYHNSGLPIAQAIMETAKGDYGHLTPEIKRMAAEISWGVPFEEALAKMEGRISSPFIKKAITIITTAEAQGGEVSAILETLGEDLRKLKELNEERKGKLSIYTVTIYVIFMLLLMIAVMLTATLAPAIPKIQVAGQFFSGVAGGLTEEDFRTLLLHVSLIEAFFAGLISGQMGEGSVAAGLKHSIVLVGITLLAFSLVPPKPAIDRIAESITEIPAVEGFQGGMMIYKSKFTSDITVVDIAEAVRKLAKERNLNAYKDFKPEDIVFRRTTCRACDEGKVVIEESIIRVNEPVMLQYKIMYSNDKYVVEFSDAK